MLSEGVKRDADWTNKTEVVVGETGCGREDAVNYTKKIYKSRQATKKFCQAFSKAAFKTQKTQ